MTTATHTDAATGRPQPPVAKKVPYVHHYHGREFPDDYHWLRDDSRKDEEMLAYIKAENKYAEAVTEPFKELKTRIYDEFITRLKEDDEEVPWRHGNYLYYKRTVKGLQYPIRCRRRYEPETVTEEEILLDLNTLGLDHVELGAFEPSPDNTQLAYSLDTRGDEYYTVQFKKLTTDTAVPIISDTVEKTDGPIVWAADGRSFFYTTKDKILRPYRVHRHVLGMDVSSDTILFQEDDEKFNVGISRSASHQFLLVNTSSSQTSETRLLDLHQPDKPLRIFEPRQFDRLYSVEHFNHQFLILTNRLDGSKQLNFTMCACSIEDGSTDQSQWKVVLPHDERIYLTDVYPFQRYVAVYEWSQGLYRLRILEPNADGQLLAGAAQHYLEFPEAAYSISDLSEHLPYHENVLRFSYTSLVTPKTIYDYDMSTRTRVLRKQIEVNQYDPSLYATERILIDRPDAPPKSGLRLPVTIVYRRDQLRRDGTNPCWLYGYGSYGLTINPSFKLERVSLLDRGFVYAIAHIRGGTENGRGWYEEEGKKLAKKNTFLDFIAAGDQLVTDGYTSHDRMVIEGRSAGGLLIGSVINLRPDLAKVAVAGVPFVDVINTMMDPSIPLTVGEYEEWGDPNDPQVFDYIYDYSPYDQLREGVRMPNLLIRAGLNDPRVQYWEPAKWCARLRAYNADGGADDPDRRTIVLLTKVDSGHFGSSGRYQSLEDMAQDYAFSLKMLGISS